MSQSDVFHLGLTKKDLQGAQLAIVPGDPQRVEKIAKLMENPVHLASHREFTSWRAELDGKAVIVCSTGIGGPSTSIAVEELAQLGIRTFLRIGTTGAIQSDINVGDVLVTTAAVRLDGASLHFAPMEFPAVADFACTTALVEAANAAGVSAAHRTECGTVRHHSARGVVADQAASAIIPGNYHRTAGPAIADGAIIPSHQPANIAIAAAIDRTRAVYIIDQTTVHASQHARAGEIAEVIR